MICKENLKMLCEYITMLSVLAIAGGDLELINEEEKKTCAYQKRLLSNHNMECGQLKLRSPVLRHWYLSTTIGSARIARRAGM